MLRWKQGNDILKNTDKEKIRLPNKHKNNNSNDNDEKKPIKYL